MAHPKRRHSNERTRIRRSHDALKTRSTSICPQCGAAVIPHRVCSACGSYRGRQVVSRKVKEKAAK